MVVDACHHLLRATMLRETADPELADELAQEALTRAWTKRDQYHPGTSPRAWLIAIARSQLMEYHRRQDRDRRHLRELVRQELLRHQPQEESEQTERLTALRACLAEIGEEHRRLFEMVHAEGLSSRGRRRAARHPARRLPAAPVAPAAQAARVRREAHGVLEP